MRQRCSVTDCRATALLFCSQHWARLTDATRARVDEANREAIRQSGKIVGFARDGASTEYLAAMKAARKEASGGPTVAEQRRTDG